MSAVADLDVIDRAKLKPEALFIAHVLWSVRDFLINHPQELPMVDWTAKDIIRVSRHAVAG